MGHKQHLAPPGPRPLRASPGGSGLCPSPSPPPSDPTTILPRPPPSLPSTGCLFPHNSISKQTTQTLTGQLHSGSESPSGSHGPGRTSVPQAPTAGLFFPLRPQLQGDCLRRLAGRPSLCGTLPGRPPASVTRPLMCLCGHPHARLKPVRAGSRVSATHAPSRLRRQVLKTHLHSEP